MVLSDNFIWWLVFIAVIVCGIAIPSLLQLLWEEYKKKDDEVS